MRNANTYAHWFAKCYTYCNSYRNAQCNADGDRDSSEYEANTNASTCSNGRSTTYPAPSSNAPTDAIFPASNTSATAVGSGKLVKRVSVRFSFGDG
jgi:hypothetical protein